jgi:8-oxo-dGTP diphosphatase
MRVSQRREYPDRPIVGVGGVVISGRRVLLVRRGQAPLLDRWSIPGGMLEAGEPLIEGVRRELAEETGLDVRVGAFLEVFERIELDAAGKARHHYVVLDYLCERIGGEARAGSDVTQVAWAAPDDLDKYALTEIAARVIRKAFEMAGAGGNAGK